MGPFWRSAGSKLDSGLQICTILLQRLLMGPRLLRQSSHKSLLPPPKGRQNAAERPRRSSRWDARPMAALNLSERSLTAHYP
jgi:hypothetical protein